MNYRERQDAAYRELLRKQKALDRVVTRGRK